MAAMLCERLQLWEHVNTRATLECFHLCIISNEPSSFQFSTVYFGGFYFVKRYLVQETEVDSARMLVFGLIPHAQTSVNIPLVSEVFVLGNVSCPFLAGHVIPDSGILPGA